MNTYEKIHFAIKNRQLIKSTYLGVIREMCPHVLGVKNGCSRTLFYQVKTISPIGVIQYTENIWLCIPLHELEDVQVIKGNWRSTKKL